MITAALSGCGQGNARAHLEAQGTADIGVEHVTSRHKRTQHQTAEQQRGQQVVTVYLLGQAVHIDEQTTSLLSPKHVSLGWSVLKKPKWE